MACQRLLFCTDQQRRPKAGLHIVCASIAYNIAVQADNCREVQSPELLCTVLIIQ